jgi:GTPase SAR1 family protein
MSNSQVSDFIAAVDSSSLSAAVEILEETQFKVLVDSPEQTVAFFWHSIFSSTRWLTISHGLRIVCDIFSMDRNLCPSEDVWKLIDWDKLWNSSLYSENVMKSFLFLVRNHVIGPEDLPKSGKLYDAVKSRVDKFALSEQLKYPEIYLSKNALISLIPPVQILAENIQKVLEHQSQMKDEDSIEFKVLLLGDAGVGKSCLINQLFAFAEDDEKRQKEMVGGDSCTTEFVPVKKEFQFGKRKICITFVDSPGSTRDTEESEDEGIVIRSNISRYIDYIVDSICMVENDGSPKAPVHVILWCISGTATRVPEEDQVLFRSISKQFSIPVIVVFTRAVAHVQNIEILKQHIAENKFGNIEAFQIIQSKPERTAFNSEISTFGIYELISHISTIYASTFQDMANSVKMTRQQLSQEQIEDRSKKVDKIINQSVISSAACGAFPPIIDDASAYGITCVMIGSILLQYRVRTKLSPKTILWHITKAISGRGIYSIFTVASLIGSNLIGDALKSSGWFYAVGTAVSGICLGVTTLIAGETLRKALDQETGRIQGIILEAESMKSALEIQAKDTLKNIKSITEKTKELIHSNSKPTN